MLPGLPAEKYEYAGNTSLAGACAVLMSAKARCTLSEIYGSMTYIELSAHPGYMDEFIAACFLPHTDSSLFASMDDASGANTAGADDDTELSK
jgi:uncharacterized 2Fe-2S/4Fe-4S cluster protein (DUF4445 family)